MPIYDYSCRACGHVTEVIHGINEESPRFCPACGAEGTLKKAFAAPAVVFKGSGWAKKDRKATNAPGKSGAGAKAAGEAGDGTPPASGSSPSGAADGASPKGTSESKVGTGTGGDD